MRLSKPQGCDHENAGEDRLARQPDLLLESVNLLLRRSVQTPNLGTPFGENNNRIYLRNKFLKSSENFRIICRVDKTRDTASFRIASTPGHSTAEINVPSLLEILSIVSDS